MIGDDRLIFCEASKDQLLHLHWVLMWFEAILGLKINLEKSELISVGRVPIMEELVDILGCEVGSLPSKYLGLLWVLLLNRQQCGIWWKKGSKESLQGGRDNICPRIRWKRQYSSKDGGFNSYQKYLV